MKSPSSGEIKDVQETLAFLLRLMAAIAAPEKLQDCSTCDRTYFKGWGTPVGQSAQLLWFRRPTRPVGARNPMACLRVPSVLTLGSNNNHPNP